LIRHVVQNIQGQIRKIGDGDKKETRQDAAPLAEEPEEEAVKEMRGARQPQIPASHLEIQRSLQHGTRHTPDNRHPSPSDQKGLPPKSKLVKTWDISQFQVPLSEGKTRFHDLDLPVNIMHAIADLGFEYCTPIQAEILPKTLTGVDATGRAQTGTGKSAAFLITILTHLQRKPISDKRQPGTPRALIIEPTRELALQVKKDADLLGKYSRCKAEAVFGGMDYQKQKQMLAEKLVDIVVATPGRLLDFKRQGDIDLSKVEILIIDEADHMLDMGFIPDVRQIIHSTPPKSKRQTMLFGATLTPKVTRLASQWTRDPVSVEIEPEQVAVDTVDQVVYLVTARERFALLYNMITQQNLQRVIVFCNRRDQTRRLGDKLRNYGINCAVLSGEVAQKKRIRVLEGFRSGEIRVLVATDVAGRGIHIDAVSHVVNYNLPLDPEDYVHRIGRTGRAGASGTSISFATEDESFYLPAIEEFIGEKLKCVYPDERLLTRLPSPLPVETHVASSQPQPRRPGRQRSRPNNPPS